MTQGNKSVQGRNCLYANTHVHIIKFCQIDQISIRTCMFEDADFVLDLTRFQ